MASTIILSDNGASSGSAGLKSTAGNDGVLILQTTTSSGTATNAVYIDNTQNVGIGTSSPSTTLNVYKAASGDSFRITSGAASGSGFGFMSFADAGGRKAYIGSAAGNNDLYINAEAASSNLIFQTVSTERMRIDSSGNLLVGITETVDNGTSFKTAWATAFYRTATAGGVISWWSNNTSTQSLRGYMDANGGIYNYSANNVNLSDRREKTNFSHAGEYLTKICSIPVQTFEYIGQEGEGLTLGVVAQDVQEAAPELVTESNWGTEDEPKMRLSIYQTDLQYALMKCIQEQQALITTLTERITALEAK